MNPALIDKILLQFKDARPISTKEIIKHSKLDKLTAKELVRYLNDNSLIKPATMDGKDNSGLYPAYIITEPGSEKARRGGYQQILMEEERDKQLKDTSIAANKSNIISNKWGLIISGIALVVSVISLFIALAKT
jgi:hypothetical protein